MPPDGGNASQDHSDTLLVRPASSSEADDDEAIRIDPSQQELTPIQTRRARPATMAHVNHRLPASTSLARATTTPWMARVLIPLLCLGTHILFYYGQTAPMWKLRLNAHIDAWANATDFTARRTFETAGLPYENHFTYDEDKDVETFTYGYAIQQLWRAKNLPGKFLPRLAAILLVMFSGVWPHLKLALLNITWLLGGHPANRTRTLHWLSCLGKWSLADVLTVCVMVGVLNLDWEVDPEEIKTGLVAELPDILTIIKSIYTTEELCDKLLTMDCANQKRVTHIAKCKACHALVNEAFFHPDWARSTGSTVVKGVSTSGGGLATLRVVGMSGIYAFCGAVIMSVLLSLVVDVFDHRAKRKMALSRLSREIINNGRTRNTRELEEPLIGRQREEDDFLPRRRHNSVESVNRQRGDDDFVPRPRHNSVESLEVDRGDDDVGQRQWFRSNGIPIFGWTFFFAAIVTSLLVLLADDLATMERVVGGAAPMLLHKILGVDWERKYSLTSLMWTTGAAGGWDYQLMATFGLFCVFGPLFRSLLLVLASLLDMTRLSRPMVGPVCTLVNFVGAFCAWEVFVIAIIMVDMLMPSITNTIIQNAVCGQISEDGSCLQVEFNVLSHAFSLIVIGGVLLVSTSCVAVGTGAKEDILVAPVVSETPSGGSYRRIETAEDADALEELVFETHDV